MGVQFLCVQKNCAVCAYWDGARRATVDRSKVDVSSSVLTGVCKNPNALSATKGKQMKANNSTCIRFEKWPALK